MKMPFASVTDNDAYLLAEKESEYEELKRSLHFAEADRELYISEMQVAMARITKSIDLLESERDELCHQIKIIDSKTNRLKDERLKGDLMNMTENHEWLEEKIDQEKQIHQDLNFKIRELQKKLSALIRATGSNFEVDKAHSVLLMKQERLENKILLTDRNYNRLLEKNTELREEIDTLKMERDQFDLKYQKISDTLAKTMSEIDKLTELTTCAYGKREEALQKVQALIERSKKEEKQHDKNMKELIRTIDHDRKITQFIKAKIKEREEDPQLPAARAKATAKMEIQQREFEEIIEKYDLAFAQMISITHSTGVDKLIERYITNEDRNYSIFNYVGELYLEMERLQSEINELKKAVTENKTSGDVEVEHISGELNTTRKMKDNVQENKELVQAELDKTKYLLQETATMIGDLVDSLRCDALEAPKGVTFDTLLEYIALVEERVNNLLLIRQRIDKASAESVDDVKKVLISRNLKPRSTTMAMIAPPNLTDGFDAPSEEGGLKIPLSREKLHEIIMHSLKKNKENSIRSIRKSLYN